MVVYLCSGPFFGVSRPLYFVPAHVDSHFLQGKKDFVRAFFDSAAVSLEIYGLPIVKIWWAAVGCPLQNEWIRDDPELRQTVVFVGH